MQDSLSLWLSRLRRLRPRKRGAIALELRGRRGLISSCNAEMDQRTHRRRRQRLQLQQERPPRHDSVVSGSGTWGASLARRARSATNERRTTMAAPRHRCSRDELNNIQRQLRSATRLSRAPSSCRRQQVM